MFTVAKMHWQHLFLVALAWSTMGFAKPVESTARAESSINCVERLRYEVAHQSFKDTVIRIITSGNSDSIDETESFAKEHGKSSVVGLASNPFHSL